jgi:flagellar basal body-associated protein FliL
MVIDKKRRIEIILIIIAIIIVLGLFAYFAIKGESSTGKVIFNNIFIDNVIANDDAVTTPARAVNTNFNLTSIIQKEPRY